MQKICVTIFYVVPFETLNSFSWNRPFRKINLLMTHHMTNFDVISLLVQNVSARKPTFKLLLTPITV
jgi:hypothetical protein